MSEIRLNKVVKRYGRLEVVHGIDLAIAHTVPGQVALHLGVGDGTFVPGPVHVVEGAAELALAEINGDGVPDLVILRPQSSAVQVLRSAP